MTTGEPLFVDFRKWPDTPHWHFTLHRLGEDVHGSWYALPVGSVVQRGVEPPRIYPQTTVVLVRDDAWWMAYWNSDRDEPHDLYIDVATPGVRREDRVTLVDLDLDVVRTWGGDVEIIDRDEFELHREQLAYPDPLIRGAEETARDLARRVAAGEEPFASVGARWLEDAIAMERHALRDPLGTSGKAR